ncbi:hypothetical protein ACFP3U_20925 [Kitasatospora misakiensis]|uniref:site-specific DNA-methyltransferase (adenine-specific) n=1 Tax=Kitasatospora misakiensis TaxID=67330 RepID=A0ABW0XAB4_9ACTN
MHIHCDHCGFERIYTGAMDRNGMRCAVCGVGRIRDGRPVGGFTVGPDFRPVPHNLPVPPYHAARSGDMGVPADFSYFAGVRGGLYRRFVQQHTSYVGRFTNLLVPDSEQFAWLTPYAGNGHNRTHFTQLLLARVAQAKFVDNRGRLPRLIEPFLGSGQVFLNSTRWGTAFTDGVPLFGAVVAGDLNHFVIGSYWTMRRLGDRFVDEYLKLAAVWDAHPAHNFEQVLEDLRTGRGALLATESAPATAMLCCFKYIWLVNRSVHGTTLNASGGVVATWKPRTAGELAALRVQEAARLGAVRDQARSVVLDFECRDFRRTCELATPQDVVFLDCPSPKFSNGLVEPLHPAPETVGSESAHTYGTGDDGAEFQTAVVEVARELVRAGVTVVLCNLANPGLVDAYQRLIGNDVPAGDLRRHTFTFRSPATTGEAYQLTVLPGARNATVTAVPGRILAEWRRDGGDDVARGSFFEEA